MLSACSINTCANCWHRIELLSIGISAPSTSPCKTGITTHQSIDTEYVSLVSAFLSRGTNYVVSTTLLFDLIPDRVSAKIQQLTVPQLEDFGEALLDLTTLADVEMWLNRYSK